MSQAWTTSVVDRKTRRQEIYSSNFSKKFFLKRVKLTGQELQVFISLD